MKRTLLFALLLFIQFATNAQYENKWMFGVKAYMDFSNGTPVMDTTSIAPISAIAGNGNIYYVTTGEADASVCDENGDFLFYTNGHQVWDSNYDLMPHGSAGLHYPDNISIISTTAQGALIVPMPDSAGKYYIFSLTACHANGALAEGRKVYYSIVDMSLNGGLGDVDSTRKGILVDSNLREGMTSIVGDHCNIWVVVDDWSIPAFKAFEINSNGINTDPVISTGVSIGVHPAAEQGCIVASPDRKKIAATQSRMTYGRLIQYDSSVYGSNYGATALGLYDFDPATGLVSNPVNMLPFYSTSTAYSPGIDVVVADSSAYSACFSPDNSKLYVCTFGSNFFQYDISSSDPAIMVASKALIGNSGTTFSQMRVGPDGKIYFITKVMQGAIPYIGCFETPDMAGADCGFNGTALEIPEGSTAKFGLPNVISTVERTNVHTVQALTICGAVDTLLSATQPSGWDHVWSDGTIGENLSVTQSGTYWLQYHVPPCKFHVDTFIINFGISAPPVITVNVFELSTTVPYDTYQWLLNGEIIPGATDAIYTVTENGDYRVVVGDNESGCSDTSAVYTVTNVGIGDLAIANSLRVYPNPASGEIRVAAPVKVSLQLYDISGRLITAAEAAQLQLAGLDAGLYLLHVFNKQGNLIKVEKIVKQ